MKETKNAELIEEKEKKLHSKNFIIHDVEEPSSVENDDAIKFEDVYITNFIAALKVTLKTASRIGLSGTNKWPIVML